MSQPFVIDVRNLSKSFGAFRAVQSIQLQVKKGEIFGFLGPNGSGKTTTLRMLCGLLNPDSGTGHCLGHDILTESSIIKAEVGYMSQRFSYYDDLTILENLQFVARVFQMTQVKQKIFKILKEFNLLDRQHQLAGNLSGGWKQRLALAAGMLHEPKLLLLDEPTAGVDPAARRQFWDKINELSEQGITTLVSTHYMSEAERCTRLAYIAYGRLLEQGTAAKIVENVGLITYKIYGDGVIPLYRKLKANKDNLQAVMFGEVLHLSSNNSLILNSAVEKLRQQNQYQIEQVPTNLEDVFIHLMENARHEPHLE